MALLWMSEQCVSGVAFFFFFAVLNKLRNYIQADGDQNISFITTLVWRTWFVCVAKIGFLTLSLQTPLLSHG